MTLTFDLLILEPVGMSPVARETFVPILVFLRLLFVDLLTDTRRQTDNVTL